MKNKTGISLRTMAVCAVVLFVALAVAPVAAVEWPSNNKTWVNLTPPIRFDNLGDGKSYYFNLTNVTGGLNAIHITEDTSSPAGSCYLKNTAEDLSGTFFASTTGGRNGQDDIILMVAINSTNQTDIDNFTIRIKECGYNWTPTNDATPPDPANISYYCPSINITLNSSNYLKYGGNDVFQKWKFAPTANYPIYCGQDMGSTSPLFKLILVDNWVGTINGTWYNATYGGAPLNDNGMTRIEYTILSNPSSDAKIAFNIYAYNDQTIQQQPNSLPPAVNWLNRVSGTGSSGWLVTPPSGD